MRVHSLNWQSQTLYRRPHPLTASGRTQTAKAPMLLVPLKRISTGQPDAGIAKSICSASHVRIYVSPMRYLPSKAAREIHRYAWCVFQHPVFYLRLLRTHRRSAPHCDVVGFNRIPMVEKERWICSFSIYKYDEPTRQLKHLIDRVQLSVELSINRWCPLSLLRVCEFLMH